LGGKVLCAVSAAVLLLQSCVKVNSTLGEDYIATNQQYDTYIVDISIDDIKMQQSEDLDGYSMYKFAFGAVRDPLFGLTTRSSAFTLVPIADTLDFGKAGTRTYKGFHFSAVKDTVSTRDDSQERILQNVYVYELKDSLRTTYNHPDITYYEDLITNGVPVYDGSDSLSFDFSRAFGEKFMTITQAELDSLPMYRVRFPGIYITTDEPAGYGGRINLFKHPLDVQDGYIYGSTAELKFSAEYEDRGVIDTSFTFYLGPYKKYDFEDVTATTPSTYPQMAYNRLTHESSYLEGDAGDVIYFEGGNGIKPVIKAKSLRSKVIEAISKYGDPDDAIINLATITLSYEEPQDMDDYLALEKFPTTMSPTCRIQYNDTTVTYAGLTDASVSTEDQGDINRSLNRYTPDITHHIQQMIALDDDYEKIDNYDIWFLALHDEVVSTSSSSSSSSEMAEYYQQLAYSSYYSSMYGYGGYGSYGSSYSNYYNYLMLASMYSSSSTSESTQSLLDFLRYYNCTLKGPSNSDTENRPTITVVFSLPKE